MKILVTGATGTVGSAVCAELAKRGAQVRAVARKAPAAGRLPAGVEFAAADLLDLIAVEHALAGVDKMFLLNAVSPDELTQALIPYGLAKRHGLKHVTYLSVFDVDRFTDVPHFASKLAVERALEAFEVPFTILRPGYFFQNDLRLRDALSAGVYPMPLGPAGIAAVDVRDIAEAAAITLTQPGHEGRSYNLVTPAPLSGPGAAEIWGRALGKPVHYPGENFDAWEAQMRAYVPAWSAYDLRVMFQGYIERGFAPRAADAEIFQKLLGHAPRSYEDLVAEAVRAWRSA
ncbi:MAG TPA: NmrA family NAD(P)-binding protein [Terriglobales bacterium]|jgi:uncharacterized protein YbjT (DUF2867 family)